VLGSLPNGIKHGGSNPLLRAFFDESGIHASATATVIAGFIGPRSSWRPVKTQWKKALGGDVFHYKNMRHKPALVDKLSNILCQSELEVVTGGFVGNFEKVIKSGPSDWQKRFPSRYSHAFELCVDRMQEYSKARWNNAPIAVTLSRQMQYAKRANEVWRTYKGNGYWPHLCELNFGNPEEECELQMADMIAYETFQYLQSKDKETDSRKWPLIAKMVKNGGALLGGIQNEEKFRMMMLMTDVSRTYLQTIDEPARKPRKASVSTARR
jgi:Protein of unknown function (DUF3800)